MTELYSKLKPFGHVKYNELLSKHTSFKLGGPADFFVTVKNKESLIGVVALLQGEGVPYFFLGSGTNVVASDEGFRGVVIQIHDATYTVEGTMIRASAGCATVEMARVSAKAGLAGFAWGVGVPGTIGGAVRGNAGAMGGEMKDAVNTVDVLRDGEIQTLTNAECGFGYRDSIFKHTADLILEVTLTLTHAHDENVMKEVLTHLSYRNKTQPQGWSSSGCIFTNVDILDTAQGRKNKEQVLRHFGETNEKVRQFLGVGKISAGWLVEQAGLKGRQAGGAQISEKHGNFIVNTGNATAADVFSLIEIIKEKVYDTYGITLEEEIQRIQ